MTGTSGGGFALMTEGVDYVNRLKEAGIPVGFIDLELTMTNFDQIKTRINAFCEILENA